MSKLNQSKILFAAGAGTILEWYDFALFAYLTPLLAALFFPSDHPYTAMMLTYAIFAVGYFVRPLGAVLFGHLGDRIGRKKTLMWSILLMSIPTCLMGLLPTYQSIGIAAPILLVILRICQGLSAGGESTGAILFALESAPTARYRGLLGGLLWAVVGAGMLCGSFAATLVAQSEADWAWRVPFLAGILTGLIGYFVRARTVESLDFLRAIREKTLAKFPLWQGIVQYKKAMLAMIAFYCLSAMITYLLYVFMASYATQVVGLPFVQTSIVATLALLGTTLLVPIGGYLSDRIGRRRCLLWSTSVFVLLSYPLFLLISHGNFTSFVIAEIIFVLIGSCFQGALPATVFEMVPTQVRYSVVAVGYNVSYSIFGGTAPLVASYLVTVSGDNAAPGWYLMAGAVVALLAAWRLR